MKTFILSIIMFASCWSLYAQTAGARFLLLRPSAASNAMGGVGVATANDAFATYFNPAGLAFSRGLNIGGSFVKPLPFFGNIVHVYSAAAYNDESIGAFGLSGNFYRRGEQQASSSSAVLGGAVENYLNYNGKLTYAKRLTDVVAVGASIGLLRQQLSELPVGQQRAPGQSTSVVFDIGAQVSNLAMNATWTDEADEEAQGLLSYAQTHWHHGLSFGLSFLNIGQSTSFIDQAQADKLPTSMLFGVAYSPVRLREAGLMVSLETEKRFNDDEQPARPNGTVLGQKFLEFDYVHFGAEASVYRFILLQVGRFEDTRGAENSYWTWGFGLTTKYFSLNLARYTFAIQPTWHFDGQFHWEF